ncbi:MAG: 3-carboxy-cis,cis-muconate cycloisomerase [bacterium]
MTDFRDTMFTTPEMSGIFNGRTLVQRMLDFEAALARAQAGAGMMPAAAADGIRAKCRVELFDVDVLFREGAEAGTLAVPLVGRLTDLVEGEAKKFVHWGTTTQDVVDTAVMLQSKDGLELLIGRLLDLGAACATLAERHRRTVMAGRTFLQHAVPITFGLKAARWLGLSTRLVRKLRFLRAETLAVQLGGAAGTLAGMGEHGVRVLELLAENLGLSKPELPWHTERDRIAEVAAALGVVAGGMGKIAGDISLLSQVEVGEVSTGGPAAKGRSSTMPHKRNPVEAAAAAASARLAIGMVPIVLSSAVQEHERAAGAWQAEWQAVPDLFRFTAGAVEWVYRAMANLQVNAERMRANLEHTRGQIMAEALTMALAPRLGRPEAFRLVQRVSDRAAQTGNSLHQAAAEDEEIRKAIPPERLERVFDATSYLGSADAFIDRALAGFRSLRESAGTR